MSTEKKAEVYISAAPGSRRFDKINEAVGGAESHISGYSIVATQGGEEMSEDLGQYPKQRFPDSLHSTIPYWDKDLAMYIFKRADGSTYSQGDMEKILEKIPRNYKYGPKRGEPIKETNIRNYGDAYINTFRRELFEGDDTLNPNDPLEKVYEDMMRGNRTFMDETADDVRSSEVMYIIRNPDVAEDREVSIRETKEEALEYYRGMSNDPDRMRKILMLFGVDVDEAATTKMLKNQLFRKVDDNVTRENGSTFPSLFITYAKLDDGQLDLRYLVTKADVRRVILQRAGIYEFEGTTIGSTFESVLDFFGKPENQHIKDALKIRLDIK